MRLFVGIPLAEAVVAELTAVCARVRSGQRSGNDGVRWSAPESWHITLQFLGNATAEQLDCLTARLAEVRSGPVPVRLDGLDVFDQAGVFLATVELTAELVALERRVQRATGLCGFVAEDRPYRPHITLARSKGDGGRRQLKTLKAGAPGQPAFTGSVAHQFLLYESHLGTGGAKYEVRQRFPMAASAG